MEKQQTVVSEETPKAKRAYKQRNKLSDAEKAIAKLNKTHKFVRLDILKALRGSECSPGTNSRLAYLKALQQLEIDYVEQITKMGVLPKNVASQTTTQYIFKAHMGQGGSVQTTSVNKQQLTDIERAEAKECKKGMADSPEDEAIRAQFEAEYGDSAVQEKKEEVPEKK
jgi:hypothetical protein